MLVLFLALAGLATAEACETGTVRDSTTTTGSKCRSYGDQWRGNDGKVYRVAQLRWDKALTINQGGGRTEEITNKSVMSQGERTNAFSESSTETNVEVGVSVTAAYDGVMFSGEATVDSRFSYSSAFVDSYSTEKTSSSEVTTISVDTTTRSCAGTDGTCYYFLPCLYIKEGRPVTCWKDQLEVGHRDVENEITTGNRNTNSCGDNALTLDECKALSPYGSNGPWGTLYPKGCFQWSNGRYYHNSHYLGGPHSNATPVCKTYSASNRYTTQPSNELVILSLSEVPDERDIEYEVTQNSAIRGYNVEHHTGKSVAECEDLCRGSCDKSPETNRNGLVCDQADGVWSARSWCVSFDYYKNSRACDLSDVREEDVGGLKRNYSGHPYDHYSAIVPQNHQPDRRVTVKPNRSIHRAAAGYTRSHRRPFSFQECKKECLTTTWCRSFDVNDDNCYMSEVSDNDVSTSSDSQYDHYEVNVAGRPGDANYVAARSVTSKSFYLTPNRAISGHNREHLGASTTTLELCKEKCISRSWCLSFDYYKTSKKCDLSDMAASHVGGVYSSSTYDYYQLNYPSKSAGAVKSCASRAFVQTKNQAIRGYNRLNFANVSATECEQKCCGYTWCRSFDYEKAARKCDLSDATHAEVGGLNSYSGNPYDHYQHPSRSPSKCRTTSVTKNAAISGYNNEHKTNVSPEQCQAACCARSWCNSFDYYVYQRKCDLSAETAASVGGLKTNYSDNPYTHYSMPKDRCNWSYARNAAISGHNREHKTGVSVTQCKALCCQRSWCKSFDYYKGRSRCDLSDRDRWNTSLKTNYSGHPYEHYSRSSKYSNGRRLLDTTDPTNTSRRLMEASQSQEMLNVPLLDTNFDAFDTNGDGILDAVDTTGDGEPDTFDTTGDGILDAVDTTGDGKPDAETELLAFADDAELDPNELWLTIGSETQLLALADDAEELRDAAGHAVDAIGDAFDTTGDGILNAVDTTGDGEPDTFDTTGDGILDAVDTTGDGQPDMFDTTGNGVLDAADTMGDGKLDMFDTNGDGILDSVDSTGDGNPDASSVTPLVPPRRLSEMTKKL